MAEQLDTFEFQGRGHSNAKHPWDEWLNGSIWLLRRAVDFDSLPDSFRSQVVAAATRRGCKVRTSVDGDKLVIQAYTPNGTVAGA